MDIETGAKMALVQLFLVHLATAVASGRVGGGGGGGAGGGETISSPFDQPHLHPHTFLLTPQLIRVRGYPSEIHQVVTDDGYILEVHRIPHGRNDGSRNHNRISTPERGRNGRRENRRVVFIQHCVLCSSADFVLNDPDQALAFILADAGYDVWLGNARGNVYGRRHVRLSPDQPEFWDFSMNEIARFDIPSMLSYVRGMTGAPRVYYIGHSMGTTVFFAMMNYHPHINDWIRVMAAMAPVAYKDHAAIYKLYGPIIASTYRTMERAGVVEVGMLSANYSAATSSLCAPLVPTQLVCDAIRMLALGPNSGYIDKAYQPVILAHIPAGMSLNVLKHFQQFHTSHNFQAYDYGRQRNMQEYGSPVPPRFSFGQVRAAVGLLYSDGDWISDTLDVRRMAPELPNLVLDYLVPLADFNHNDFLWAENANRLVYDRILNLLQKY
ncbi:lipase 3-like [Penaeus chinensis]|uniref:lipase 3-like n=1 Tax=Penaeus chinensis TaxID=139456 RepID=UPI001FB6BCA3|nr:lipase 3-like [Penaeus chinensis]XP_047474946.1 lipase 3-like [Penaeus chinensis]